jgi:hypothetical protein
MKIPALPFTVTDWSEVPATKHAGETGDALWRTLDIGDLRVRMVEYSPAISPITGAIAGMCSMCSKASWIPNCATGAGSR